MVKWQLRGFPRGSFPCRHPACSTHEGQAECQHANAPPPQVPGREVAGFQLAPCLPFATWNPPPSPPGISRQVRPGIVGAKAFAKPHQPAGRASGPLRNFRPHNAPKISLTSDNQASRWPNACPPPFRRRPASHLAVRSQESAAPRPDRVGIISLRFIMGKSSVLRPDTRRNTADMPAIAQAKAPEGQENQQPSCRWPFPTGHGKFYAQQCAAMNSSGKSLQKNGCHVPKFPFKFVIAFLLTAAAPFIEAQTFLTLCSFSSTNGANPGGALIQGNDGNFYGTTEAGGLANGTLFNGSGGRSTKSRPTAP